MPEINWALVGIVALGAYLALVFTCAVGELLAQFFIYPRPGYRWRPVVIVPLCALLFAAVLLAIVFGTVALGEAVS